jgi:hypothetical protein
MAATLMGSIRKRLTAPPTSDIRFTTRGFDTDDAPAQEHLEFSAFQLLLGFELAVEQGGRGHDDLVIRLESVQREYRGFAYEGAVMGLALRDAMSPARGHRITESFMAGPDFDSAPGSKHVFMGYLGVGFTLAHLPKPLWRRALPDYARLADYPAMRWMVMDGYGFHLAYFDHRKYVDGQHVGRNFPGWDPDPYVNRAIDQGIGRAMWFVYGANVKRYIAAINRFPESRQADLFSGAGVAASYAGGVSTEDLETLLKAAGRFRPDLAQGSVFALRARVVSDTLTPHSELAAQVLCGLTAQEADDLAARENTVLASGDGSGETYELYRQRIMQYFR